MSKGRRVPPPTPTARIAAGLHECDCDTCARVDRILQREIANIESVAMRGYRDHGRGVVRVRLCRDCGEHIADTDGDKGIDYIPQIDTRGWPDGTQAQLAAYPATTHYIILIADYSIDKVAVRQVGYRPPEVAA